MAKVTKELIAKALKLYHGTNVAEDFKEFVPAKGIMGTGVYATPDTHAASTYAAGDVVGKQRGTASRVIPVDANLQNVFDFDNATKADEIRILEANGINADEVRAIPDNEYKFDRTYLFDEVLQGADPAEVLGKAGYDGATAKEAFDRGGVRTGETYQSYVTYDPKNLSSSLSGAARPDVLAGVAGGSAAALGLAKALQNRQERDKHGTIEAPKNPTALKLADAIRDLDRRTKGSPANLLVPTSTAQFLSNVGYNQKTPVLDKVLAAAEWLP